MARKSKSGWLVYAGAWPYLASDAASYITGEIVLVDGGRMTLNHTVPA